MEVNDCVRVDKKKHLTGVVDYGARVRLKDIGNLGFCVNTVVTRSVLNKTAQKLLTSFFS